VAATKSPNLSNVRDQPPLARAGNTAILGNTDSIYQPDRDITVASFLKSLSSLFGGGREIASGADVPAPKGDGEEYNGFVVRPAPYKEGGQYQTCGFVEKEIDGELKTHKFIRADRFASLDDAVQFSLTKGKQLIDEQGEGMFR
jgi:hypothetical protein